MKSRQWKRIGEIIDRASKTVDTERAQVLDRECAGDVELRRKVEALLESRSGAPFLQAPAVEEVARELAQRESRLKKGQHLGSYTVVSLLGKGGMGEVYRAGDARLGRDVALKVLPSSFAFDPERSARFDREARLLASLNHPKIATIYGLEEHHGLRFLVLELVEEDTLAERIERGPIPFEESRQFALQIAEALEAAHSKGIVHRDLKPSNVKVTPEGRIKVLDFGLAKALDAPLLDSNVTQLTALESLPGIIMGTPPYMSPEQARGGAIDVRTDIWAFGCLFYELLSAKRAFSGGTVQEIFAAILGSEPDWDALPPKTPKEIQKLLGKCLEKDINRRLVQIGLAREAIEKIRRKPSRARSVTSGSRTRRGAKRIRSLAVLPLASLSSDPDQGFFADGMTDALITTIAQIGALRVISRTSVMQYKGARKPLPQIAEELNVDAVLEGTVLRSSGRVRITTQLIDARSDTHLWANNYEGDLSDVLKLQNEVAEAVAQEIRVKLPPPEKAKFATSRSVNPESYELYLKGRYYWYRRTPESLNKALECLQKAVAIDPTYVPAQSGVADAYVSLGWDLFGELPPRVAFPRAKQAAAQALRLDSNYGEARGAQAWVSACYDWDWSSAEREFANAVELVPQYGPVHIWYSHFLHAIGRIQESTEQAQKAVDCDPLGLILNLHLGWHHIYERDYEKGIGQLRRVLDMEPAFVLARLFLGEAYEQVGRFEDAIAEFEKACQVTQSPVYLSGLGHAYAVAGQKQGALAVVDKLRDMARRRHVPARGIAEIYTGLGDADRAFECFNKAVDERNGWLIHANSNPRYDRLRGDPRFADLLRRIGLPS